MVSLANVGSRVTSLTSPDPAGASGLQFSESHKKYGAVLRLSQRDTWKITTYFTSKGGKTAVFSTPRIQQTSVHIQTANHVIQRILGCQVRRFFVLHRPWQRLLSKWKTELILASPLQRFLRYVHDSCIWQIWSFAMFCYVFWYPMNLGGSICFVQRRTFCRSGSRSGSISSIQSMNAWWLGFLGFRNLEILNP